MARRRSGDGRRRPVSETAAPRPARTKSVSPLEDARARSKSEPLARALERLCQHPLVSDRGAATGEQGEPGEGPLAWLACEEHLDVATLDRRLGPAAGVRFATMQAPSRRARRARSVEGAGPGSCGAYDRSIVQDGVVPTREGHLHDLLNAVAWAWFPRAKRRLHARQHEAIARRLAEGARGRRTREEDALALLDEGGALLAVQPERRDALDRALCARDERALAELSRGRAMVPWLFGHALLEHLARGDDAVRGTVLVTDVAPAGRTATSLVPSLDAWLAARLERPLGDPRALPSASLAALAGRAT